MEIKRNTLADLIDSLQLGIILDSQNLLNSAEKKAFLECNEYFHEWRNENQGNIVSYNQKIPREIYRKYLIVAEIIDKKRSRLKELGIIESLFMETYKRFNEERNREDET